VAFLGIDAGASATKWTLLQGGEILASGREAAMDAHLYREESVVRMREVIHAIAEQIRQHTVEGIVLGITGYSESTAVQGFFDEEFSAPVKAMSDIELAYRANFSDTAGVLIYAGTGSVALTFSNDHKPLRIGGWGYLLGDEGAGYWIGREGLRAAMLYIDGQVNPEVGTLEADILKSIGAHAWDEVKSFVYGRDRNEMAALSTVVAQSAAAGDVTATVILKEAAQHLIELVHRAEEITGRENISVKFAGGVSAIPFIADEVTRTLGDRCSIATADISLEAARLAELG
jgi:N-acetylglucosamine kinase-like BadF-type ATPase